MYFPSFFNADKELRKSPYHSTLSNRLLKNAQMQGPRDALHLPVRQAILMSEAYSDVRRNDEG
jgi:hypothetical protein